MEELNKIPKFMIEDSYTQEIDNQFTDVTTQLAHTDTYVKRKEVDIWDFVNLVTIKPDPTDPNTWDWTLALQEAINQVINSTEYNKLKMPPGKYKISDVVGYSGTIDVDIGLHIIGSGRTASTGNAVTIEQTDSTKNCLQFLTSSGNLRGLVLENIQIFGGKIGLNLQNNAYNYFKNVQFSRQTEYCLKSVVAFGNNFDNCWFVHASGNTMDIGGTGATYFNNCTIGEDVGSISVSGCQLYLNNCSIHDIKNNLQPLGLYDLGNNAISVYDGGQLFMNGGRVALDVECAMFLSINNQRPSRLSGVVMELQDKIFLKSRYQTLAYAGSPFSIIDCNFVWSGNGILFENGIGVSSSPLKNSVMSGCNINYPIGSVIQTEDWFLNPANNNIQSNNTVREGAI